MHTVTRKFSTFLAAAALPFAALMAVAGSANAAPIFDTTLVDPPGVYFGTGNTNAHFVTNTSSGIELGLGTVKRYLGPIAPDAGTSVYNVLTGATGVAGKTGTDWGFEYSINTRAGEGGEFLLSNITSSLCVQDVGAGGTTCFSPLLDVPDNAHSVSSPLTTAQNSEALQFNGLGTRFFDPLFDINANDTYIFTLTAFTLSGESLDSVQMTDIAGTGAVPEPISVGLLGAGLVGLAMSRRRKNSQRTETV